MVKTFGITTTNCFNIHLFTEESCGDWSQGWDYQCDECNFAAVINKWMLKQFVVVIPNVLTIVNKMIYLFSKNKLGWSPNYTIMK